MNDNIIKMFIGGEEVVSNKEFTINEEMLSASSTILNNCYPATWEESKDYVSNFYYPKDYSKFILGKGNFTYGTDQYSILSVSGETFMQFTTNVEKEWNSFNVYGNTYQETRSGKNLLKIKKTVDRGLTTTINNDGSISINGVATENLAYIDTGENIPLTAGTYTLSIETATTVNIRLFLYNGSTQVTAMTISSGNKTTTTTINQNITSYSAIIYGLTSGNTYNLTLKLMLESGSQATPFEPFGVMPSPNYPSKLISVGYKNIWNSELENGEYDTNGNKIATSVWVVNKNAIDVDPNTTYTISQMETPSQYRIIYFNNNTYLSRENNTQNTTIGYKDYTFTTPNNCSKIYIQFRSTIEVITSGTYYITPNDITNVILTQGTQVHSYIPYNKYGIEVKNIGKNLLYLGEKQASYLGASINISGNEITFNGNDSGASGFSFTGNRQTIYIPQNTQLTYSVSYKSGNVWSGGTFVIRLRLYYEDNTTENITSLAQVMTSNYKIQKSTTFIASKNISKIEFYGNTYNISGLNNPISFNLQLEKGNIATEFETYKENSQLYQLDEPLKAIGEYKDRLYIENGMLYVDRKIGNIMLNGSENWENWSPGLNYCFRLRNINNLKNIASSSKEKILLCDYFKIAESQDYLTSHNTIEGMASAVGNLYVRLNQSHGSISQWLSTHNTEVQYVLNTPYTEEIGQVNIPYSYEGINNITFGTGIDTEETVYYYWKNFNVLFAGIVKNSGDISLRPTNPKYCSLQILDYKTFLSESDTLDFVISDKTIAEAISMVVDAISGYGFVLGTIDISQADDIIGAYSTLNKTAYDVFQYLANISGSRWRARFVDSDTMAIDFYDPELLPRANDIDYTQQYWEDNKIVDLTFNYGTRDYRNKQIILSDEVYGGIDYTEVLLSNGYGTSYITQNNIANITSITVNGVEAEVITQSEKDLGVDADFYYTPGKNVVESTISYTAGTQIIITYTPLVKGRQIVYNDEEVTRIATQTNTTGIISRYENRNDILSSDELENIAESYIKYKGKPEIILKLTTLNNDLFNIGEICYFNSPIADLAQDYMVKSKATNYTSVAGETNIFYTYELTSSFNSEKAINYFDNQRNKATGNIAEGESITRNIDINNSAMIIWENATITEISVSVDGDNALNSVLNSPFIQ